MSVKDEREATRRSVRTVAGVVGATFGLLLLSAAVAYSVMVNVVDWMAVGVLAYPVAGIAPFVVISGAILTIPILIPTALITARVLS